MFIHITGLWGMTTNDQRTSNNVTERSSMNGGEPNSEFVLEEFSERVSEPIENNFQNFNESTTMHKDILDDDDKYKKCKTTEKVKSSTKSTQTIMEKRMCYRCALVIQHAKLPQDTSYDNITSATEKKGITIDISFGVSQYISKQNEFNPLETMVQEENAPRKSPTFSTVSISRHPSNYSMAENSGYKEIFKEIFLILHNAHDS